MTGLFTLAIHLGLFRTGGEPEHCEVEHEGEPESDLGGNRGRRVADIFRHGEGSETSPRRTIDRPELCAKVCRAVRIRIVRQSR